MDMCGAASRPSKLRDMANILFAVYNNQLPTTVGKNWPSIFYIIDEKNIQSENIYNFDKIGFAINLISAQKVKIILYLFVYLSIYYIFYNLLILNILQTVIQLQKQVFLLKQLLKQQSNSSPISSKILLDQIIKDHYLILYNTALFAQDNVNLYTANKKKHQKRNQLYRQIFYQDNLSIEEGLLLAEQLNQKKETDRAESHI
ncbi:hypothetical protein N7450_010086 [Penicillium hetheringtonii]|uniref:Transmembrane protein n=1 Tax=Penicillium hetheringtonii TaxID=911720 RepID=A0AAD6DC71_9EURO|nr:hypothetical protein N7450_010086 [Penicillium hetheringtonii]